MFVVTIVYYCDFSLPSAPPEPKLQNELSVPFNTVEEVEEFDKSLSNIDVQKDLVYMFLN